MDDTSLIADRRAKDEFFGSDHHSPIPPEARAGFKGLSYYPPTGDLVFTVAPEMIEPEAVTIATTSGDERQYARVAKVDLSIEGEQVELFLYETGHPGYFVPFRDATSGSETYGAGRYLDIEANEDGTVTVDFNLAYHPYCAYNSAYSCAVPPAENWLTVPIRAGERLA